MPRFRYIAPFRAPTSGAAPEKRQSSIRFANLIVVSALAIIGCALRHLLLDKLNHSTDGVD